MKKIIIKNFLSLMSSQVIGNVISFILAIVIARYLGAEGFGKYAYAFAFANITIIFTDFGINTYTIREVSKFKHKTQEIFGNASSLKLLFSLLVTIISLSMIYLMDLTREMKIIVGISTVAMIIYYIGTFYRSLLMAYEIMEYEAIIAVIERIILLLAVLVVIFKNQTLIYLVIAFLIAYIFSFLLRFFIVGTKINWFRLRFDINIFKSILKTSLPFWVTGIFTMLFFKIDSIMLKMLQTYNDVGVYNAASKLIEGLGFMPIVMVMAVFPAMARLHMIDKKNLNKLYNKSVKYLFGLILPISIGTTMLAPRIMAFVYGGDFLGSEIVLQILIWAELLLFINYIIGYLLNSIDRQKDFTISCGVAVIINIILNLILINKMNYVGAAISTLISQSVNFLLLYMSSSKIEYKLKFNKLIKKPIIAAIPMIIAIILLFRFHIIVIISIAAIIYLIILILIRYLDKEETELIKSFLLKKKR